MKLIRWISLVACLVAAGMLSVPVATSADDIVIKVGDPEMTITIGEHDWYGVTPPNPYVVGKLGAYGSIALNGEAKDFYTIWGADWGNPRAKTLSSTWNFPGRWAVDSIKGDPESTTDNYLPLTWWEPWLWGTSTWPCYYFGYWKVKVGDKVYFIGEGGFWSKTPFTYTTPPSGLSQGRSGGFLQGEWTVIDGGKPVVTFLIRMSCVRDQVRFELTTTNLTGAAANIGLQMVNDTEVSTDATVGYPYIPGIGCSRQAAGAQRLSAMLFGVGGSSVPDMLEIVDSIESPGAVARLSLRSQDCTPPDYLAIGEYRDITDVQRPMWLPDDFKPDPLKPVYDVAWAACWAPRAVAANATRKIVTYYGVGAASAVWNHRVGSRMQPDSVALAVQGPPALKFNAVNGTNFLDYPDKKSYFDIKAYVYNLATDPGPYDLDGVTLTLYLPPGLELTSLPPQDAQQTIGRVPVSAESSAAVWQVQATGEYSGALQYFITARASSGWQQVVSRTIMVPATKWCLLRGGYQLVNVPFTFNNQAIDHAFSPPGSGLPRGSYAGKYFDTKSGQYLPVTQLVPGQAFWMYVGSVTRGKTVSFQLAQDAAIIGQQFGKQVDEHDIDLLPGWNLIGNPFVYPVYWGQVLVWNKAGNTTVSLDQAVTSGWLSKTLFTWIPESGTYESFKSSDRLLVPWRGYWVHAKYPVTLVFRPSVPPGSDVTANTDGT